VSDEGIQCPVCRSEADGGPSIGDYIVVVCPRCGGYRLAETAMTELGNGTLPRPDPEKFSELVTQLRGDSGEYPLITSHHLRSL